MAALLPALHRAWPWEKAYSSFSWLSGAAWPWDRKESRPSPEHAAWLPLVHFSTLFSLLAAAYLMALTLTSLSQAKEARNGL